MNLPKKLNAPEQTKHRKAYETINALRDYIEYFILNTEKCCSCNGCAKHPIRSTVSDKPLNNCGEKYCSRIHPETKLENQLVNILSHYCGERGDNEGAVETLERIVEERNLLLRRAVERDIFHKI